MIPSNEALYYHWKRSCWVLHMWRQVDKNSMVLRPITEYGWTLSDNKLTVVWDTLQNMQAIHDRVNLLLKGCKCVTCCTTKRCGCERKNTHCSEGCQCINCLNMPSTEGAEDHDLSEIALEEEVTADITQLDTDTDELIDWVFGADMEVTASVEDNDEVGSSLEDMQWLFITITCNVSKQCIFSPSGNHFETMTHTHQFWCIKCLYTYQTHIQWTACSANPLRSYSCFYHLNMESAFQYWSGYLDFAPGNSPAALLLPPHSTKRRTRTS